MTIAGKSMDEVARDPEFARAHARLLKDGATQFDFPEFKPPEVPAWLKPLFEAIGRFLEFIAPAVPYIFWTAVGLGVAAILWLIIREVAGTAFVWPWQRKALAPLDDDWRPDAAQARILLSEAEALAAQGRFAEAARLLLQRSVADIGERRPDFLKPSLTAREIARAEALPTPARSAFAAIARVVEVSAFGSAVVTADAWTQCRDAYGDFALAGAWRG